MNMERLIRMIFRKLLGRGINAGIKRASRGNTPPEEMTPAERRKAREIRQNVKRARQAARLMRRMR